ncbi:hypothetical protein BGZ97_002051 [Linnemannia gamsii]|uniref:Uncharacterized protein n=1 Tax=Linnemannia gamsii TaxID=64522 RepID=A0A9P6QXF5_9FUNG|nr:hypothetical protein BGZ97_002051 [Linnemannia gamsii]
MPSARQQDRFLTTLKSANWLQFPNGATKLHANISINFEIEDEDEDAGRMTLHYVEFNNRFPTSSDYVEGESKPHRIISVAHVDNPSSINPYWKACAIDSYAVSASGSHVVTLSFTNRHAHIDLWNLSATNDDIPTDGHPRHLYVPYGTVSIELPGPRDETCSYFVGISGSGLLISLCPQQKKDHSLPFGVLRCASSAHFINDSSLVLEQTESHKLLQDHFGYGAFHCIDIRSPTEENDRFVACNGPLVHIFSITSDSWELQHTLELRFDRTLDETLPFLSNMRCHYFMWPGVKGELTLWDVESGEQKDGFDLPNQNPDGIEISLALDSSISLVARASGATIFATRSNVIIKHYDTKGRTRILGSYLAQGHVILNTKPLISDDRLCTLKVLNYHENMAEEFELTMYQDYRILCLPRSKDLIMGYHRGSILNVIQHENIIPTEPREYDDHSCNLQTIQLSDISLDSVHQQVLDAGPTIELA